jgi:murein DD-endopeptidase MepM/ murein hydrolase activator NlpD
MNNKKFVRIMAVVLAVLMFLSVAMMAITALASTTASARTTQSEINRLRAEKREYERQKREIQSRINTIEFERMAEIEKKEVLDSRITLTGHEIDNIKEVIHQFDLLIREKEYEVVIAQNREESQLQRYKNRVRDMEENGIITYLEIIFGSTSFSDLLARIDFVSDIMRADENSYYALQEARNDTEAAKEALEDTKAEHDEELIVLEEKEAELLEQLEEAQALILRLEADIESERELRLKAIAEEERVQREINAAVAELRRQQEAERQRRLRLLAQGGTSSGTTWVTGTGDLMWPVNGRITSPFGVRAHPVFGDLRQHSGIDIGASHGTSVVAADGGTVITSTYNANYGNYIVIDHGNGMTTLYAHLSSRAVSRGASVTKGQHIGNVGSTGISTGPHLHFEVSVNGTRVNPLTRL